MVEHTSVFVNPTEKKILSSLRELPDGQLKTMLENFMLELADFIRDPKCAEVQADGIPCASPDTDCEQCLKVRDLVSTLRASMLPNQE